MSTEDERAKQILEERREQARREQALEAGIRTHISQGHQMTGPNFTAEDVIGSAQKYYDFLKGESVADTAARLNKELNDGSGA